MMSCPGGELSYTGECPGDELSWWGAVLYWGIVLVMSCPSGELSCGGELSW